MSSLIVISVLAIVILYLGLFKVKSGLMPVAVLGLLLALGFSVAEWNKGVSPIFSGMMLFDNFAVAFSSLCIGITALIFLLSRGYFEKISQHLAEYYTIMLFSLAGCIMMVSYNNLAMLFVGLEIMSVSLYILAGIKKKDFGSNEAALKYFLMGAFSTGFLLFGIALIYGASGTFNLQEIANYVSDPENIIDPIFYAGLTLMIVGLVFKVGAAPFHFWTPDVYEGAPTLITTFMSTVVKIAGFAAFLRIFQTSFAHLSTFWTPVLTTIAVLTLFVGNLTALYQNHFKRLLAYSSISHAGYMLFAIVALGPASSNAIFIYALAYALASVVAFGVLILVETKKGSDAIESFNGLSKTNPFLALALTVAMLSFAGIPLTAGFIGKFYMFSTALSQSHIWLVAIAVLNAIVAMYYYFKVIIAMYFKEADGVAEVKVSTFYRIVLGLGLVLTILLGIYPSCLTTLF